MIVDRPLFAKNYFFSHSIMLSLAFFMMGCVIQIFSYLSIEPLLIGILIFMLCTLILRLTPLGGEFEFVAFMQVFSVCWFWAGIAAVYANQLDGWIGNAATFFDLSVTKMKHTVKINIKQ